MSWIKPTSKRLARYGPQAALLWKYAGKPAGAYAAQSVASATARRSALKHADTLIGGAILKVFHDGHAYWVVYSGGAAVASHPTSPVDLGVLVEHVDLSKKMTPDQVRARAAANSVRRQALDAARGAASTVRRRGSRW